MFWQDFEVLANTTWRPSYQCVICHALSKTAKTRDVVYIWNWRSLISHISKSCLSLLGGLWAKLKSLFGLITFWRYSRACTQTYAVRVILWTSGTEFSRECLGVNPDRQSYSQLHYLAGQNFHADNPQDVFRDASFCWRLMMHYLKSWNSGGRFFVYNQFPRKVYQKELRYFPKLPECSWNERW